MPALDAFPIHKQIYQFSGAPILQIPLSWICPCAVDSQDYWLPPTGMVERFTQPTPENFNPGERVLDSHSVAPFHS